MTQTQNGIISYKGVIDKTFAVLFVIFHIVYALDFGQIKRGTPSVKFFIKICSLLQLIFIVAGKLCISLSLQLGSLGPFIIFWVFVELGEFITNSLMLIAFSDERCFRQRYREFLAIKLHSTEVFVLKVKVKFVACVMAVTVYRYGYNRWLCWTYEADCPTGTLGSILYLLEQSNFAITIVVSSFLFYLPYCQLKTWNNYIGSSGDQITEYLLAYKEMYDAIDKVKEVFDYTYLCALAFRIPDLLMMTYYSLKKIEGMDQAEMIKVAIRNMYTFEHFILLSGPPFCAGLLSSEAHKLKIILLNRLLQERNEKQASEIAQFAEYVTARPLKLKLKRFLPLDWSLPVALLNICLTYQIIIVQFTLLL